MMSHTLAAQPAPDPAGEERARWMRLHETVRSGAATEAACTARFSEQIRDARNAAQAYLRSVSGGIMLWAKEREDGLPKAPAVPKLEGLDRLLEMETAETAGRLKALELVRTLAAATQEVQQAQERVRFEWRGLPEAFATMGERFAPLAERMDGMSALLRVQQRPLQAEAQRIETIYDLLESDVSRRCARAPEPAPTQDPFAAPTAPARKRATKKQ